MHFLNPGISCGHFSQAVFFHVIHNGLKELLVAYVFPELVISQTNIFISLVGSKSQNSTTSRHGTNNRYLVWSVLYMQTCNFMEWC